MRIYTFTVCPKSICQTVGDTRQQATGRHQQAVIWSDAAQLMYVFRSSTVHVGMDTDFVLRCNVSDIRGAEGEQERP